MDDEKDMAMGANSVTASLVKVMKEEFIEVMFYFSDKLLMILLQHI